MRNHSFLLFSTSSKIKDRYEWTAENHFILIETQPSLKIPPVCDPLIRETPQSVIQLMQ